VGALCCVALLLLISPGPVLFNETKFVYRDVAAVQKEESPWPRPHQLIDKSSLVPALFSESELISYAASDIGKYRLSSAGHHLASLNIVRGYRDSEMEWVRNAFSRRDQDAGFHRREFTKTLNAQYALVLSIIWDS
jgi:hypothetical protein